MIIVYITNNYRNKCFVGPEASKFQLRMMILIKAMFCFVVLQLKGTVSIFSSDPNSKVFFTFTFFKWSIHFNYFKIYLFYLKKLTIL